LEKILKKSFICLLLFILFFTVLVSGCIEVDVTTGIDSNFTAFLVYDISLDVRDVEPQYQDVMRSSLNRIGWHYQEYLGFTVELHMDTDPCTLVMTRRVENGSFAQAYGSLKSMLTNEDFTLFMLVDIIYEKFERQTGFSVSAMTDLPQIMRLSNAEELPPGLSEKFEEAILNAKGSITLNLPASEIIDSSHPVDIQNNRAIMVVPMSYTDRTELKLTGVVNLLRDGTPAGTFEDIVNDLVRFRNIAFYSGCTALILMLITLLIAASTKKRKKKLNYNTDIIE